MKFAHLADIQIRAHSRHDEYRESFRRLYDSLNRHEPDRIVLVGDIVHNKTNISPELVDMLADFLHCLARIAPTDIVLGNHDLSVKNPSRLDAIKPVVNALSNPKINLMRKSQIYRIDDRHHYAVMSILDEPAAWEEIRKKAAAITDSVTIALWHGTLAGVLLDNGTRLDSPFKQNIFDGIDYAMLGDIHVTQTFGDRKHIAYPGSYPKQSYGEGFSGGYFLWDISGKRQHTLKFVEIEPVCPFYTLILSGTQLPERDLQKNARVRLVLSDAIDAASRKRLIDETKERFCPVEIKLIEPEKPQKSVVNIKQIEDLRDETVQKKLLQTFFAGTDEENERLFAINAACNRELPQDDVVRNLRYRILRTEFDNLFSYGENNSLDFTAVRGLVGVFGANGVGKSSLVPDVLMFGMFNKVSKDVSKNNHYVNDQKQHARVMVELEANGSKYTICRETKIKCSKGIEKGSTDVHFCRHKNGEQENLTGLERSDTDKAIRKVFGTAEDFMLTSIAPQFGLLGFLELKPAERKKTIARYFDLEVFERKHAIANDTYRALKRQIALYPNADFDAQAIHIQQQIHQLKNKKEQAETKAKADRRLYEIALQQLSKISINEKHKRDNAIAHLRMRHQTLQQNDKQVTNELHNISNKYTCMSNPDCCMRVREQELKKQRAELKEQYAVLQREVTEALAAHKSKADPELAKRINEQTRLRDMYAHNEQQAWRAASDSERQIATLQTQLKQLAAQKEQYAELQRDMQAYERFTHAMGKDGISYQIITQNLSLLNGEINRILSADTTFSVFLRDEDRSIEIYFQQNNQQPRLIELCSGMERTIAAIAIRAALLRVTSLPVSNILVLDESFTALDAEHMEAVGRILSALKDTFDIIFIICHNDYAKDLCDNTITVQRNADGFSVFN